MIQQTRTLKASVYGIAPHCGSYVLILNHHLFPSRPCSCVALLSLLCCLFFVPRLFVCLFLSFLCVRRVRFVHTLVTTLNSRATPLFVAAVTSFTPFGILVPVVLSLIPASVVSHEEVCVVVGGGGDTTQGGSKTHKAQSTRQTRRKRQTTTNWKKETNHNKLDE